MLVSGFLLPYAEGTSDHDHFPHKNGFNATCEAAGAYLTDVPVYPSHKIQVKLGMS